MFALGRASGVVVSLELGNARKSSSPILSPPFFYPPIFSLASFHSPLNPARKSGRGVSSPAGSGAEPQPKSAVSMAQWARVDETTVMSWRSTWFAFYGTPCMMLSKAGSLFAYTVIVLHSYSGMLPLLLRVIRFTVGFSWKSVSQSKRKIPSINGRRLLVR